MPPGPVWRLFRPYRVLRRSLLNWAVAHHFDSRLLQGSQVKAQRKRKENKAKQGPLRVPKTSILSFGRITAFRKRWSRCHSPTWRNGNCAATEIILMHNNNTMLQNLSTSVSKDYLTWATILFMEQILNQNTVDIISQLTSVQFYVELSWKCHAHLLYFLVEHIHCQICLFRNRWAHLLARKHEPPCLTDTDNMNISYWFCINIHKHCFNHAGSLWNASWVVCVNLKLVWSLRQPCGCSRRPSVQSTRGDERPVWLLTLSGIVRYEKWHYYGYTVTMDPVRGVEKHQWRSWYCVTHSLVCVCVELDGKTRQKPELLFFFFSLL